MNQPTIVTLGTYEFPVVAQPHSRIRRGIVSLIDRLPAISANLDGLSDPTNVATLIAEAGESAAYDALALFIPAYAKRVPLHEFMGFASVEAMDMDVYDADLATDPTVPQIVTALKAGLEANDLNSLGKALTQGPAATALNGILQS